MRNFKFRLQTVLEQRERIETVAKQTYAEAEAALQRGQSLLGELGEVRQALLDELCRQRREGFDANETRVYQEYLQTIMQSIREQEDYVRELTIMREANKLHLTGAAQKRQVLAGVKDRHKEAFVAQRQRLEQNAQDELASVRHAYGRREG